MTAFELAAKLMAVAAVDPNITVKIWNSDNSEFEDVEEITQQMREGETFIFIDWADKPYTDGDEV